MESPQELAFLKLLLEFAATVPQLHRVKRTECLPVHCKPETVGTTPQAEIGKKSTHVTKNIIATKSTPDRIQQQYKAAYGMVWYGMVWYSRTHDMSFQGRFYG